MRAAGSSLRVHQGPRHPCKRRADDRARRWRTVSDRRAWLSEWCPYCRAAPGSRCRLPYSSERRPAPGQAMHLARGWRQRSCPTCHALPGDPCHTPTDREASRPHSARLGAGRQELGTRQTVWEELQRRDAALATPRAGAALVRRHASDSTPNRSGPALLSRRADRRSGQRSPYARRARLRAMGLLECRCEIGNRR